MLILHPVTLSLLLFQFLVFVLLIIIVLLSQCLLRFNFTCFEIDITTFGLFLVEVLILLISLLIILNHRES